MTKAINYLLVLMVTLVMTMVLMVSGSLPFLASTVIDVDGDGREELFLGGDPGGGDRHRAGLPAGAQRIQADP